MGAALPDPALAVLLGQHDPTSPALWFADEHWTTAPVAALAHSPCQIISPRYDVWQRLNQAGLSCQFSDFNTESFTSGTLQRIYHRIAKEKPVVHHLINRAADLLAVGGELWLAGGKHEGIRSYCDKAGALFGHKAEIRKHGMVYIGRIARHAATAGRALEDNDYPQLRKIAEMGGQPVFSKPGVFAWDKIDHGSALLAEYLPHWLASCPKAAISLLDLGCGYGYLALMARHYGIEQITATDNNAAALSACQANFAQHGINGQVIASHCGDSLPGGYDRLLCNPPFHRGFNPEHDLTPQFLAASARLLAPKGRALWVVNRFIPLERLATPYFRHSQLCTENRSFQVFELARPITSR